MIAKRSSQAAAEKTKNETYKILKKKETKRNTFKNNELFEINNTIRKYDVETSSKQNI